ncbi:MAG: hypothetical protein HY787_08790 [Deltaproteobacteria bacterium]|nr:hypothetical protein [Deltaproteobacteria bacterium]
MKKELSDRINRIYMFLLRLRKTLSNFNPLPAEADDPVRQVIRFVRFCLPAGGKAQKSKYPVNPV